MSDAIKEEKEYGLIIPKKNTLSIPKPGNIFGDESGSDAEDGTNWVRKALRAEGEKNLTKKQTQLTMKKAMKEDPTVYQYDEVYDDMERTKVEDRNSKKVVEKKSKYIENLLKAADRRKREHEHRLERMVQKEREAEGAMFADKESFVTSAYREKLEEFKKMEEEEKRMDRLEAIGDVTKQKDMSGFYRHLYRQTVDGGEKSIDPEKVPSEKVENEINDKASIPENGGLNVDADDPITSESEQKSGSDDESNVQTLNVPEKSVGKKSTKRQYRKRVAEESQSSSESDQEAEKPQDKDKLTEKLSDDKLSNKKQKLSPEIENGNSKTTDDPRIQAPRGGEVEAEAPTVKVESEKQEKSEEKKETVKTEKIVKKTQPEKPKISIWEKRTVGPAFEAALERYYARKAVKLSG